ncbi:spermidine synthase [Flavobacterium antarcticum]|uniref:spermidine synthase n=1 Tax=Flavobacterium antarcticum TaxID=271155 RepID=UPI0003B5FC06|nr:fused MFS/spermidine synthase [Flavobacterium antarcticum]
MLKKWLSYIVPINIKTEKSHWSKTLEVTWANGELVLDSAHTNYSYGSLQRILRIGLLKIGFERIAQMNHILVLGVAGGSVIKTLVREVGYSNKITGVEIDANVIAIAKAYFELDTIPNFDLILDDAFEFVLKTKEQYDLIIIDIFQDTKMPNFLFEAFFVNRILELLVPKGLILFNTMCLTEADNNRNKSYLELLDLTVVQVQTIPRVEAHNEVIIIEKLGNHATT